MIRTNPVITRIGHCLATRPPHLDDLVLGLVVEQDAPDPRLFHLIEANLGRRHFLAGLVREVAAEPWDEESAIESLAARCDVVVAGVLSASAGARLVPLGVGLERRGVACAILVYEDQLAMARDAARSYGCPELPLVSVVDSEIDRMASSGLGSIQFAIESALCEESYRAAEVTSGQHSGEERPSGPMCAC